MSKLSDEEIALKLTEIKFKNYTQNNWANLGEKTIYEYYEKILSNIENRNADTKICKIKQVYEDNKYIQGGWCSLDGIRMLEKIQKIIDNDEDESFPKY